MPLPYNHADVKERIISLVKTKGPSLPVHIARSLSIEPLFSGAFLSELYRESKLMMSHLKIGSSALYLLPGQEGQLENFIEYLNQREKEAFFLLKQEKVLEDEKQTPVIRVALRAIKDFAIPVQMNVEEKQKLFWKYHLVPESEIQQIINHKRSQTTIPPPPQQTVSQIPNIQIQEVAQKTELQIPQTTVQGAEEIPVRVTEIKRVEKEKKKPQKKEEESRFQRRMKEQLADNGMELIQLYVDKKKEMMGKIRIDTKFGKQELFFIAKDKKKVSPEDLASTLQKAQSEKMPSVFLSPGELDKKAIEHLKEWGNLIKFEKLKL